MQQFIGFQPQTLAPLNETGIAERWYAVQEQLHPQLAALMEQLDAAGRERFPAQWPLYEISYKSQRYVNKGRSGRAPIDEYHAALDRPPRGSGIYIAVSGAERQILVAMQMWRIRKPELLQLWEQGRALWEPLLEGLPEVRFTGFERDGQPWVERYLHQRGAGYLLAGYSYSWDDPHVARPDFAARIIEDVLSLFPLNEALMEQAEELSGVAAVREAPAPYGAWSQPGAEAIVERIQARGFIYPEHLVRSYHLALQTKPLVILPGISGTGKTRLTRLYADAVHNVPPGKENQRYLLVAVQPDWHNARDLLGYYNALSGRFHATPLLRFLLRAAADPGQPYFVCLDEMNLARPEYYLAPILSALETAEHEIDLGVPAEQVELVTGELLRSPLRLPLNVMFTGTVNVDESSHTLSDKILDRANVIELTEIDLDAFRRSWKGPISEQAWQLLVALLEPLREAGQPFGYRTVVEVLRYVDAAQQVLDPGAALDMQVKQKLLPKLRGEDSVRLRRALVALLAILLGRQISERQALGLTADELRAARYPESTAKVAAMLQRLEREGYTDFYGS